MHNHLKDMGRRPELPAAEQMSINCLPVHGKSGPAGTKIICDKKLWAEGARQSVNNMSRFLHLNFLQSPLWELLRATLSGEPVAGRVNVLPYRFFCT